MRSWSAMIGNCRISIDWIMRGARIILWSIRWLKWVSSRIDPPQGNRRNVEQEQTERQRKISTRPPSLFLCCLLFLFSYSFHHKSKSSSTLQGVGQHLAIGEFQDRPRRQTARQAGDAHFSR